MRARPRSSVTFALRNRPSMPLLSVCEISSLVAVQRRKVEARAICADARAVVRIAPDLRGVQQSLRRDTAAVQAGPAALAVLNNSRMQAKLRGAQRRYNRRGPRR